MMFLEASSISIGQCTISVVDNAEPTLEQIADDGAQRILNILGPGITQETHKQIEHTILECLNRAITTKI